MCYTDFVLAVGYMIWFFIVLLGPRHDRFIGTFKHPFNEHLQLLMEMKVSGHNDHRFTVIDKIYYNTKEVKSTIKRNATNFNIEVSQITFLTKCLDAHWKKL